MLIPFGTGSYQLRSRPLSAQRMVNCYLEAAPPQSKTLAAVVQSAGIAEWGTVGAGLMRGGKVINGIPYVVSGEGLYRVDASGAGELLGTIPGTQPAYIAGDGINVMVVTGGLGYVYTAGALSQITDTDFPGAAWLEYLDGYMIVGEPESGRVWIAGPLAPTVWDALDFATAERAPDDVLWGLVDHGEVFLFGRETTEVWYNSGDAGFPLSPVASGAMEVGIMSAGAAGKLANAVYFLGNDGIAYQLNGYTPTRISAHGFEQAVDGYADKSCRVMTWKEAGHGFVAFTFAEGTWVYDAATQLWHERQSTGYDNWRPLFVLRAYEQWLAGDATSNKIGALDADTFSEWGAVLRSSCTSPAIAQENQMIPHDRVELVFEQGVGLTSGQGSDPQVMLDWSDDGGRTWSNEKWRGLGAIGEYRTRTVWNRCGQSRDRVYRFAISDPVRRTLINATLNSGL